MATVAGQGTTYNLPNFTGELYAISPSETPFLASIGSIAPGGGMSTSHPEFEWQAYDLRTSTANNVALEGANAPAPSNQSRANFTNICEIHHSSVEVSYSKLSATQLKSGLNNDKSNPVTDELRFQIDVELKSKAIDVEKSFLSGVYQKPTNNSTPRKTRGLLTAITTNVNANGGTARPISKAIIDQTLLTARNNGTPLQSGMVFMMDATQRLALSNAFLTAGLTQLPMSRNVAGVDITQIVTTFGTFGIMENRWMPAGQIVLVNLQECSPVFMDTPGKGHFFLEPLAKVGSSEKYQLYGEIGLKYGHERNHALIKDLA
jgi:Family of unknown function (DUF5309)